MKQAIYILTAFLLTGSTAFGQATQTCDTIYDLADTMPQYDKGDAGLMNYMVEQLSPVISECITRDNIMIASLRIRLTIDKNGKVIDATFPKLNATYQCKDDMKKQLMTMSGWAAGKIKGQPVCCHMAIPINCIKWSGK